MLRLLSKFRKKQIKEEVLSTSTEQVQEIKEIENIGVKQQKEVTKITKEKKESISIPTIVERISDNQYTFSAQFKKKFPICTIKIHTFLYQKIIVIQTHSGSYRLLDERKEHPNIFTELHEFLLQFIVRQESEENSLIHYILNMDGLEWFFRKPFDSSGYTPGSEYFPHEYLRFSAMKKNYLTFGKTMNTHLLETEQYVLETAKQSLSQAKQTYQLDFPGTIREFYLHSRKRRYHIDNHSYFYFLGKTDNLFDISVENNRWTLTLNEQKETLASIAKENITTTIENMFEKEYKKLRLHYAIHGDSYYFKKYCAATFAHSSLPVQLFYLKTQEFYDTTTLENLSFEYLQKDSYRTFTKSDQKDIFYGMIFDLYVMYDAKHKLLSMNKELESCIEAFWKQRKQIDLDIFAELQNNQHKKD